VVPEPDLRSLLRHPFLIIVAVSIAALIYLTVHKSFEQADATSDARKKGGRPIVVALGVVGQQMMADRVESLGTAGANESIDIKAKVPETINKIHFVDGALVKAGDLLIELTNSSEASRLAEAQASANDAKRQYERQVELEKQKMVATTSLDQARTNMETANARLEGVMVNMRDRLIRAPFTGILGFRQVSAGTLVSAGTIISTLDDISTIKLDFTVSEAFMAALKPGLMVRAKSVVYRDRDFSGEVKVVGSRVDPVTRSVQVRAHIPNPDAFLRPGMLLTVTMDLNEQLVVVVPEQAVLINGEHQFVITVDDATVAHQVEVTLGRRRPGIVEILSGLTVGQKIVVEGVAQVRSGQPVKVLGKEDRGGAS
jgi:membrane fusion protein (multidrug efflux system)